MRDLTGTITGLYDTTGAVVVEYKYDAYGRILSTTGSLASTLGEKNPFKFKGYYYDTETGLYYLNARYYNPEWGRFLNADIVIGKTGELLSHNIFNYCGNNPVMNFDPNGHDFWSDLYSVVTIVAVAAVVAVAVVATAGAAGAAIGMAAGMYLGASAATVATVTTAVTVGGYVVAGTVAACGVSDSVEVISGGQVNPVRDWVCGGDQATYNTVRGAAYLASMGYIAVGSSYPYYQKSTADPKCFVAGTLVSIEEGSKPIEEIRAGDYVWSEEPETGEVALKQVVKTFVNEKDILIEVSVNGTIIKTTEGHRFWVEGKGWVHSEDLKPGDFLRLESGNKAVITDVTSVELDTPVYVYNFEVQDWHTYFVTKDGILVHNAGCGGSEIPNNPKYISDSFLKSSGVDPHQLKYETLGSSAQISQYNIYKDVDGSLWLQQRGTSTYIPTYERLKY